MGHNKALDNLTREQLVELLEIYAKNWLAADGIWFQSVEKRRGMEEAMYHDVEIWKKFTVVEALKLKKFLHLPEHAGLEGLASSYICRNMPDWRDWRRRCHSGFMPTLTTTRSVLKGTRCFIAWLIVAYKRQENERVWNFIPAKQWG